MTSSSSSSATHTPRRALCRRCERPQSACICGWIRPVETSVELLILQHPLERGHAKNSAGLLQLSVANSRILVGEIFDRAEVCEGDSRSLLLYPRPAGEPAAPLPATTGRTRLVVLDATWRKSRKMLHLNPWLLELPRLALEDTPASRYLVRKAHRPDQLSTLEAACAALALIENDGEKFETLLKAYDGFVAEKMDASRRRGTGFAAPGGQGVTRSERP